MKTKNKMKETLQFISFAFYPKTTLFACAAFSGVVMIILIIVLGVVPKQSIWYDIVFALTTGAAGSSFVSIVVELTNNYRHNLLAWHELRDYYSVVADFESNKQVLMQLTPSQRAKRKAHEEFVAAGGIEELDEEDQPKDIIQITWRMLPRLIPVFKRTLDDKKEFLAEEEINELLSILSDYQLIQHAIRERILLSPMTYDALNHPDEDYLLQIYPADVVRNMPEWIRKHLASTESEKACDRYADAILSDKFLFSQFMKDYDISQRGIELYQAEIDRAEKMESYEPEDIDYDELDYSEPEDEETFRAQNEEFDRIMEQQRRPHISWHISSCCKDISESIENLEKNIKKKPYYGMLIDYFRRSAKEPLDDTFSAMTYESEKRQLNKRLAKQKAVSDDK